MGIDRVGIIGGGQMGAGIAEVCIKAGVDVVVHEDRLNELFSREAAWIAELEERAAQNPELAQQRLQELQDAVAR